MSPRRALRIFLMLAAVWVGLDVAAWLVGWEVRSSVPQLWGAGVALLIAVITRHTPEASHD
jgi:fatty acid desaturase